MAKQIVLVSAVIVSAQIYYEAVAQEHDHTSRVRTVRIADKQHTLEESIPIISAMLRSGEKHQREKAMGLTRFWGHKLQNSAIVTQLIDQFSTETDYGLQVQVLQTLCTISDSRAVEVFKQAAAASDMTLRIGGAVGLSHLEPGEAIPMLLDSMLEAKNPMLINAAFMRIQSFAQFQAPEPPSAVWIWPNAKKKYRQEFLQWWQVNKDRLLADWKARNATDQKVAAGNESAANTTTITAPKPASELPRSPTQKQLSNQKHIEADNFPAGSSSNKTQLVKLIASAAAGLAILGLFLWAVFRKKP